MVGQAGHLQPLRVAAAFQHAELGLQHEVEELAVTKLLSLGTPDQLVGGLGDPVQAQLTGVAADPLVQHLSHGPPPRGVDRSAVDLDRGHLGQHVGKADRRLLGVGQGGAEALAGVAAVALAALGRVDLDLGGTEAQLDGFADPRAGDRVAATLEADQPVTSDLALGARDDEAGIAGSGPSAARSRSARAVTTSRWVPCTRLRAISSFQAAHSRLTCFYTPMVELPFAGHPTVGAAWLLARERAPVEVLRLPAGEVGVRHAGEMTYVAARPEWAPRFEYRRLGSPAEVRGLSVAGHEVNAYAWAWIDESTGTIRARSFVPEAGIAEDEATGSAAIGLCARLERPITVHQGHGSVLVCRPLAGGRIEVGGKVVLDESRQAG